MAKNKIVFESYTEPVDGAEKGDLIKLVVVRPSPKVQSEGDKVYNKAWMNAYKNDSLLRDQVAVIVKDRGIWNDNLQAELEALDTKLIDLLKKIRAGGVTKLEGRKLAIEVRKLRNERMQLTSTTNNLDNQTCEAQAENARFDYYVSACTLDAETGKKPYFNGYDDYVARKSETVAGDAATNLVKILYDYINILQSEFPENRFLRKFGYCDDQLRLIDKDGNLCDEDFRRVDENGFLVNDKGERIDEDGNLVDVDSVGEFLDDTAPDDEVVSISIDGTKGV